MALLQTASGVGVIASPAPINTLYLAAHGDSITRGYQITSANAYPYRVKAQRVAAGTNITDWNEGVDGIGFFTNPGGGNLIARAPTDIDPLLATAPNSYLAIFAGTNDYWLSSRTPAQINTDSRTYLTARIAAGWIASHICICTMLDRQSGFSGSDRATINANFVTAASDFSTVIARFDLDSSIGPNGAQNNPTWSFDTIHWTTAAHGIMTTLVYGALFP